MRSLYFIFSILENIFIINSPADFEDTTALMSNTSLSPASCQRWVQYLKWSLNQKYLLIKVLSRAARCLGAHAFIDAMQIC